MSTMTERDTWQDQLRKTAEGYRETLAEIWEAADGILAVECFDCEGRGTEADGEECPTCEGAGEIQTDQYEGSDPFEYLDEMPLEIVWEPGEPFAVVLGTGGPHIEITGGGRSGGCLLVG